MPASARAVACGGARASPGASAKLSARGAGQETLIEPICLRHPQNTRCRAGAVRRQAKNSRGPSTALRQRIQRSRRASPRLVERLQSSAPPSTLSRPLPRARAEAEAGASAFCARARQRWTALLSKSHFNCGASCLRHGEAANTGLHLQNGESHQVHSALSEDAALSAQPDISMDLRRGGEREQLPCEADRVAVADACSRPGKAQRAAAGPHSRAHQSADSERCTCRLAVRVVAPAEPGASSRKELSGWCSIWAAGARPSLSWRPSCSPRLVKTRRKAAPVRDA